MKDADPRLRTLYRLAERTEGEALERVRAAIHERRRAIELATPGPSAFDGLPVDRPPGLRPTPATDSPC